MSKPAFDPATGKPVFDPSTGKPALGCSAPCDDCSGDQPDATVTVAGSCTDHSLCGLCEDTYEFVSFDSSPDACSGCCMWTWQGSPDGSGRRPTLHIVYCETAKEFCAAVNWNSLEAFGVSPSDCDCQDAEYPYELLKAVSVTCNAGTGHLSGSFSLPGQADDIDCSGCTATITLGG